jgi:hypothetical protein
VLILLEWKRYKLSVYNGAEIAASAYMRKFLSTFLLVAVFSAAFAQGPGRGDVREPAATPRDTPTPRRDEPEASAANPAPETAAPTDTRSQRAASRCKELSGALREQCLLQEQGAASGAGSAPEPRTAPPPQNPR